MQFSSESLLDDSVIERDFSLGDVPGILWAPEPATGPYPLILLGHPGGLRQMKPRLVARARQAAATGFAAATIELPGGGDRPKFVSVEEARANLRRALESGDPVDDRCAPGVGGAARRCGGAVRRQLRADRHVRGGPPSDDSAACSAAAGRRGSAGGP